MFLFDAHLIESAFLKNKTLIINEFLFDGYLIDFIHFFTIFVPLELKP